MAGPDDKRAVEVAGRNWLISQLLLRNIQVALPEVDSGIDLIAYLEVGNAGIKALPIQLKCASARYFGLRKKYEGRGILQAFLWEVLSTPRVFFVEYEECLHILGDKVNRASWKNKGLWDINRVSTSGQLYKTLVGFESRWLDPQWLQRRILGEPVSA